MPCYRPIDAYRSKKRGSTGKQQITFRIDEAVGFKISLPCGQCIGCRLEKSRQWAMRCVHEASLYDDNCFLTLTYNDENLPVDGSLNKEHWKGFMKRLRARFPEHKIRYYHCGEYGERYMRPHYHACIFNFDFIDKVFFKTTNGQKLYTSATLEQVWPWGFSTIGSVTFESAAYVARYIMKKVTGEKADEHYKRVNPETGEIVDLVPEYTTMSRGGNVKGEANLGGIGSGWFSRFSGDVFPDDCVVIRGKEMKPPKFYDELYEIDDPIAYATMKADRVREARKQKEDNTWQRLQVKETVKKAQIAMLKREVE